MKSMTMAAALAALVFASAVDAGGKHNGKRHDYSPRYDDYEYARVIDARPIYREVRVSNPVRECWNEPVYHVRGGHKSAGGMLAGGLIGGIVGHQIGKGRGNKVATAVGTLIGAKIGHDAVNGNVREERHLAGYEERCETHQRVSYEEVLDGYDVTYVYRGNEYQLVMPYNPGKRIKMRVQFSPVI